MISLLWPHESIIISAWPILIPRNIPLARSRDVQIAPEARWLAGSGRGCDARPCHVALLYVIYVPGNFLPRLLGGFVHSSL